jgi:TPR repeat protein
MRYARTCVLWILCTVIVLGTMAMQAHTQASPNQGPQVTLIEQQAQQGSAQAQYQLGYWYRYGHQGLSSMNLPQAALWLTKAAQQGYAPAQDELANLYFMFWPGQNYTQAMYWYQKAVAQGASAISVMNQGRWTVDVENIGWMYLNGLGVTKNQSEAISWLKKVPLDKASASQPGSMEDFIGGLYLNPVYTIGTDRANDLLQAQAWLQKAAHLGNQDAAITLAQYFPQTQPAPAPAPKPTPAPQQAAPQHKDLYGSIAVMSGHGMIFGWGINFTSQETADTYAMGECHADGCQVVQRFNATCAAYAVDQKSDQWQPTASGWAVADTAQAAQTGAMAACQSQGGTACRLTNSGCTDGF